MSKDNAPGREMGLRFDHGFIENGIAGTHEGTHSRKAGQGS